MARVLWLAEVLRDAGLTVVEHAGWRTRGKDGLDPRWQVFHHTASAATGGDAPSLGICINGRADLPGPLCHVVVARSGVMHVVASGVANHAGAGTYPDGSTGNRLSIGWEAENDGVGEPWPSGQLEDLVTAQAAVCRHLGLSAGTVIGHKEYTTRKIDPTGIDMASWRRRIQAALKPPELPQEDDDMHPFIWRRKDAAGKVTGTFLTGTPGTRGIEGEANAAALAKCLGQSDIESVDVATAGDIFALWPVVK